MSNKFQVPASTYSATVALNELPLVIGYCVFDIGTYLFSNFPNNLRVSI